MELWGLIIVPFLAALAALAWDDGRRRPWLLPAAAGVHALLTLRLLIDPPLPSPGAWLSVDALGLVLLGVSSALFLGCSIYGVEYLRRRQDRDNRLFTACYLFMLSAASVVAASRHLGLMWVAMEATTLSVAPLINFKQNDRSLEATWKYLIMGGTGIGLALLGTYFLALAAPGAEGGYDLYLDDLLALGPTLSVPWLKGAFIFMLVGYGLKMGLAPLHSWKPDAYGEAPGIAGAALAGVLTGCAFLGVLRVYQVCLAAGQQAFTKDLLIVMGLLSLATAAVFMVSQRDFKRLLAYSSVEHMGLLVLGLGIGGAGLFAALLHFVNNGLGKGLLFLAAGNIHRAYGDKTLDRVHGALRRVPVSATLFLIGAFAITGSPPFGLFLSEFMLLKAIVAAGRWGVALAVAGFLGVIFIGMVGSALSVAQGAPPEQPVRPGHGDSILSTAVPGAFAVALLILGLYIPAWLTARLSAAAALLGGAP
ncbi:MAG: hydrogenase [Elusimicrobia bacterium CG11_big_fil_rev_8_21_14_0_20_64_6]|nr:MAG: hydrogenase [Elusimicrobia bacterium CG11_big_fil_rev_8_21_14_0_20_64_6]